MNKVNDAAIGDIEISKHRSLNLCKVRLTDKLWISFAADDQSDGYKGIIVYEE